MDTNSVAWFTPSDLVALVHDSEVAVGRIRFVTDASVNMPFEFTYSAGVGGTIHERAGRPESELVLINAAEDIVVVDLPDGTRVGADTPLDGVPAGAITAHAISGYNDCRPIVALDSGNVRAATREDISES